MKIEPLQQKRNEYPRIWGKLIKEWQSDRYGDAFWLTYSANYLLNTAGVRWAIDPYSLFTRIGGGRQPDFLKDLKGLQLVVLTHAHADHLDLNIIQALSNEPITWVIPEFMLEIVMGKTAIAEHRIAIPQVNKMLRIGNLSLMPFEGLHFHGEHGIPSMGYLVEFNHKRWLFPGDTRTYEFSQLPTFGELDGVVAHLWLGKGEALEVKPSKIDSFCEFFSQFKTDQLIITHLYEYGRDLNDLWDLHHFKLVKSKLQSKTPWLKIIAVQMGEHIEL